MSSVVVLATVFRPSSADCGLLAGAPLRSTTRTSPRAAAIAETRPVAVRATPSRGVRGRAGWPPAWPLVRLMTSAAVACLMSEADVTSLAKHLPAFGSWPPIAVGPTGRCAGHGRMGRRPRRPHRPGGAGQVLKPVLPAATADEGHHGVVQGRATLIRARGSATATHCRCAARPRPAGAGHETRAHASGPRGWRRPVGCSTRDRDGHGRGPRRPAEGRDHRPASCQPAP